MPFIVPTLTAIRDDLLRDLRAALPDADVGVDSDYFVRATSIASAVEGLYEHQAWLVKQIFPDTADSEYLALHARVRGLNYKSAVSAGGKIALTGTPNAAFDAGLVAKFGDASYTTTESGTLDATGNAVVSAAAQAAGIVGNLAAGTTGSLMAPPNGIVSKVTIVSMVGGVEVETDAELLARLLDLIRRPPAGGNRYDYRRWAMEVPGVSAAYVYPLRRGLGTVDVVITSAGELPSEATIQAVQTHIDDLRPVTAKNCLVLAPTPRIVDLSAFVQLSGLALEAARAQIATAEAAYFNQIEPGTTAYRSRIEAIISGISGVVDRQVVAPAGNVVPIVNEAVVEWLRLGNVQVQLLP
ncbi:Baseplate protein J-like domain-containing protein [Cupriavidus sp. H19C3]|uniref:baseplate J/gp47 family protein n=1 Tax=Cupriavidus sp. H19C3 TaxID=3241603 RepID=UPI003BF8717E